MFREQPERRALIWLIYTALIAEALPFGIFMSLAYHYPTFNQVVKDVVGFTMVLLIGFGTLVAASGDRLLEHGYTRLRVPLMNVVAMLCLSLYFFWAQFFAKIESADKSMITTMTAVCGICAIFGAAMMKYDDFKREASVRM